MPDLTPSKLPDAGGNRAPGAPARPTETVTEPQANAFLACDALRCVARSQLPYPVLWRVLTKKRGVSNPLQFEIVAGELLELFDIRFYECIILFQF